MMDVPRERRKEPRLRCRWPVWFTEGLGKTLYRGRMLDLSSEGVAFTCHPEKKFPRMGQEVTTHFNVPRLGPNDATDMTTFTRLSHIYRIDPMDEEFSRVAVHFDEPLNFTPGASAPLPACAAPVPGGSRAPSPAP